jgi:hypothetical protein
MFRLVKFIAATAVLGVSDTEISVRNSSNFAMVRPVNCLEHVLLKSVEERKKMFLDRVSNPMSAGDLIKCAVSHGFQFLGELFECLDAQGFALNGFGANMSRDRMCRHLQFENSLLDGQEGPRVRQRRMRNCLLQGDRQGVFGVLLSTPPDDPNFALEVIKAAFVGTQEGATTTVAALVAGGNVNDAVDLCLLTNQGRAAARLLLVGGDIELAVQVVVTMCDARGVASIAGLFERALVADGNTRAILAVLMAWRMWDDVARILRNERCDFIASVVGAVQESGGTFCIRADPTE